VRRLTNKKFGCVYFKLIDLYQRRGMSCLNVIVWQRQHRAGNNFRWEFRTKYSHQSIFLGQDKLVARAYVQLKRGIWVKITGETSIKKIITIIIIIIVSLNLLLTRHLKICTKAKQKRFRDRTFFFPKSMAKMVRRYILCVCL